VLVQIPQRFFLREIEKSGGIHPDANHLVLGGFFFPQDEELRLQCRTTTEAVFHEYNLHLYGWRPVPVNTDLLCAKAAATMPCIEQALLAYEGNDAEECERLLYLVRKGIERRTSDIDGFYIPSLSSRAMIYKGMLAASQLAAFYPDLRDTDFET